MGEKERNRSYQEKRKKIITITAIIVLAVFIGWTVMATLLTSVYAAESSSSADEEMRGIWVSTVYALDYPESYTTDAGALMQQADEVLDNAKEMGMNAVFLQVRPSSDALYDSAYYPWSRYLTGTQGVAPQNGFDPLRYWVQAAHQRGMELHAWINPYRVTRSGIAEYDQLSADNPAKQHPEWLVLYEGNYYFDPALPEVRQLVVNGALEIVRNYDVDGIHLDDYFYPGQNFDDADSYARYGGAFDNIGDFRRDNVNQLIRMLDEQLHAADPDLSFGVSPSGIWANNTTLPEGSATRGAESYSMYYADSVYWAREGIVDYLAPQIYWNIGYSVADYSVLAEWWSNILADTGVKLYIGMADYRSAQASGTDDVWYGTAELERQLDLNRATDGIDGEIHFRYRLMQEDDKIPAFLADYYGEEDDNNTPSDPGVNPPDDTDSPDEEHPGDQPGNSDNPGNDDPAEEKPDGTFEDVSASDWFYEAVEYAASNGLMNGMSETAFDPAENLSRAMMVTILYRLDGSPEAAGGGFDDVERGSWYENAVIWADANGIVNGYGNGIFGPDEDITREQMAAVLYRYAAYEGYSLTASGDLSAFRDASAISGYAESAMGWAVGSSLISGKGDGILDPAGTATRAEVAQILMNFCENIVEAA